MPSGEIAASSAALAGTAAAWCWGLPDHIQIVKPRPDGEVVRADTVQPTLPPRVPAVPLRIGRFELQLRERPLPEAVRPSAIRARA